jgi:hypothetical protein
MRDKKRKMGDRKKKMRDRVTKIVREGEGKGNN